MLKKIPVQDLRLGMHVHSLEGRWIEHPFWKTRFTLDSTADLQRLRDSSVAECWIDISLGLDVAPPAEPDDDGAAARGGPSTVPASLSLPLLARATAAGGQPRPGDRPLDAELREAAAICERGREAVVALFNEARMGRTVNAEGCMPLVDDIASSVQRNPGALVSLARLKSRDDYSYMHSVAVCALMVALGRQLGMDDDACRIAGAAGLMHDIGKAVMPLEILNKPGRLTPEEYEVIRAHPARGHALLLEGRGAGPEALDVVLHHHERMDGQGYPERLPAERISRLARMGAICDVYDAITSNRPYKSGWDPAESIARMASWKGQFDETLFAAFVQSLGIYPTGSLVRLESGHLGVVVEQNPHKLVAPVVNVFYSLRSGLRVAPRRLDLSQPGCADRIVGRQPEDRESFGRIDELWAGPEAARRAGR